MSGRPTRHLERFEKMAASIQGANGSKPSLRRLNSPVPDGDGIGTPCGPSTSFNEYFNKSWSMSCAFYIPDPAARSFRFFIP